MARPHGYIVRVREDGQWKHISWHRSFRRAIRLALTRDSPDGWTADVIPSNGGVLSAADRAVWERARTRWREAQETQF
jgi:hypothetical protein